MEFITVDQVREKLTMPEAIDAMRKAFADLSSGKAIVPDRLPLHTADPTHYLVMPAHFPSGGITTVKSVSLNGENPGRGLPFIQAMILVFDHDTGEPRALVDGSVVTVIRTAAASGLATELFSDPDSDIGVIFGTGALAVPHIQAMLAVRDLSRIYVFGRSIEKSKSFCETHGKSLAVNLVPTDDKSVLQQSDIICTTTTSSVPLFRHKDLKPGVHINAVGVYKPSDQEIPEETVVAANVFVDQVEGALGEAGDLLVPMSKGLISRDHFSREIGQVINGDIEYVRDKAGFSLFKSVGNAIQDAAAVSVLLN